MLQVQHNFYFLILSRMIQYGQKQIDWDELNFDLTADACILLIVATDKLFLVDLKELFRNFHIVSAFLNVMELVCLFQASLVLEFDEHHSDCFLSGLYMRDDQFYEEKLEFLNQIDTNELSELELHEEKPDDLMNSSFLFDQAF